MTINLWDAHRDHGVCYELEGVFEEAGVYGTPEGHEKRRMLSERFSKKADPSPAGGQMSGPNGRGYT